MFRDFKATECGGARSVIRNDEQIININQRHKLKVDTHQAFVHDSAAEQRMLGLGPDDFGPPPSICMLHLSVEETGNPAGCVAVLPPDPVVAHITKDVRSRPSATRLYGTASFLETAGPSGKSEPDCLETGNVGWLISRGKGCERHTFEREGEKRRQKA